MLTLEQAMAKASKLLKLSTSSNANEAALAASMAQQILTRYGIDQAALAGDGAPQGPVEPIGKDHAPLEEGGRRLAGWKAQLAAAIAKANACRAYTSGPSIGIIGRASDVASVRYLYATLALEVERLTQRLAMGQGRTYSNSFRHGVVAAIAEKLAAARAAVAADMRAENSGAALVRIDNALQRVKDADAAVDAWIAANMKMRNATSRLRSNATARAAGYSAGQSVNVGGRAAIAGGRKLLGA